MFLFVQVTDLLKITWKLAWNLNEITPSTFDELNKHMRIGKVKNTPAMETLLAKTKEYTQKHREKTDIWKSVRIVVHDPQDNELILIAGNGSYRIIVGKISGKPSILCMKDGNIVIERDDTE